MNNREAINPIFYRLRKNRVIIVRTRLNGNVSNLCLHSFVEYLEILIIEIFFFFLKYLDITRRDKKDESVCIR